ncbi:MAG: class I SAM-dependent methyltransferase [Coriobacteriia bacterium]|nr:class I SAM-dependent methyltransferase [Coriobacteriia bacterium]
MDYIKSNKAAWEEAFENRKPGWGEEVHMRLSTEWLPFFNKDVQEELEAMDFIDKSISQFCCNNGRELMSLMQLGASSGVGFDIAENIIESANSILAKTSIEHCQFVVSDIMEIPDEYNARFDFIFFTIGAITWFEDLRELFKVAARCLKRGGILMINDSHPMLSMLAVPGEEEYDADNLYRFTYPYFYDQPWVNTNGMEYLSGPYESKPFTSFTHTMSDIINALSVNQMKTIKLNEYDYDVGITDVYDGRSIPLSYILLAEKS